MRQSAVLFEADGLKFEGIVAQPEEVAGPAPGVVICHPGPLNGGNMDNNVVLAVALTLADAGFTTLRFNFRGVGNSQGEHAKGELEHQEALAAMEFLKTWPGVDGEKLGLAGYSFGNGVILGSAELQKEPRAFALISPSPDVLDKALLKPDERPKIIVTGEQDRLAQSGRIPAILDSFAFPPACHVIPGADHFWVGLEGEVTQRVSQFFSEHLK